MRTLAVAAVVLLVSLPGVSRGDPAFERTEHREACASYVSTKQPLFGELHLHTQYSADASSLDTRNTPRDAYRFARGEKVGLPPFVDTRTEHPTVVELNQQVSPHPYCLPPDRCEYTATRVVQQPAGRALDFTAVTDHSEWMGEGNICTFELKIPCNADSDCLKGQTCYGERVASSGTGRCVPRGWGSEVCSLARQELSRLRTGAGAVAFASYVLSEFPQRFEFCKEPGAYGDDTCRFQAKNVWEQIISDAEEAYDRTSQCGFTSFVAYEYTSMPGMGQCQGSGNACFVDADCPGNVKCEANTGGGNNLHRNIIFRNANVLDAPISYMEVPTGCGNGADCQSHQGGALASPVAMLRAVRAGCNGSNNCDFLSIPHNPNVSGGAMFLMPESATEASVRARFEPLVEIMQIKGGSECRYSAQHPGAWGTLDEQCAFETVSFAKLGGQFFTDPTAVDIPPNSFVRNVLKDGVAYAQANGGLNPFQLGFVGGTDSHNGTPGATEEGMYSMAQGHGDLSAAVSGEALNETDFLGLETNGGGLTVAWAEENSRDAIFSSLKRRETYATSGTRPIVRMFGGFDLPAMCRGGDFADTGYKSGVPMGGVLRGPTRRAPTFAVSAMMDPGWQGHPGTKLQQIQIVKGWVDAAGNTHEQLYDVAGKKHSHAWVDLRTCEPRGPGYADLCAQWTDPDFDPAQHAFYYARVLENPSCRWNQYYCASRGVDCSRPSTAGDPMTGYTAFEYQQCCAGLVPQTTQERAWTSPIWYSPRHG